MIKVTGIATQARTESGSNRYRFREENEIKQALIEATVSRNKKEPLYSNYRGIPYLNANVKEMASSMEEIQNLYNKKKELGLERKC